MARYESFDMDAVLLMWFNVDWGGFLISYVGLGKCDKNSGCFLVSTFATLTHLISSSYQRSV